jgi:hypothetical protein
MKKSSTILAIILMGLYTSFAQSIVNNGSTIYISDGSTLTFTQDYFNLGDGEIQNNGQLDVLADWTNNGTTGIMINGYTGSTHFAGSSPQTISGATTSEFNDLYVESDIDLFADLRVWNDLHLSAGKIDIKNNDLDYHGWNGVYLTPGNYVIAQESGKLKMFVDMMTPATFPVGTSTTYNPVTLTLNSASDSYSVNLSEDVLTNGSSGSTIPEINDCVNMTWNIDADNPSWVDYDMTVQWDTSQEGSSFDRTQSAIGEYHTGQWNANAHQVASGSNPYTVTQSNIEQVGNFAVGDIESPMAMILALNVDLTALLEGAFSGTEMSTGLNTDNYLPLNQPYNIAPWNYAGGESVAAIPNANIVDWVLVETRDAANAASATPATMLERQAALVLKDGSIVATDGSSNLQFNTTASQNLYVVIYHRNHLSVMSANALTENGGIYAYNFTTGGNQAYANGANGQKEIATGIWGMFGGDGNGEGNITNNDYISVWKPASGTKGYQNADYNLNGQVDNKDKNDIWLNNNNISSQVPQ